MKKGCFGSPFFPGIQAAARARSHQYDPARIRPMDRLERSAVEENREDAQTKSELFSLASSLPAS